MHINRLTSIIGAAFLLLFCTLGIQAHAEDKLRGQQFLDWNVQSQDFYLEASIGMASLIAARNDEGRAQCLEDWYFSDMTARNNTIRQTISEHLEFHPRAVILSILQQQCGSFEF